MQDFIICVSIDEESFQKQQALPSSVVTFRGAVRSQIEPPTCVWTSVTAIKSHVNTRARPCNLTSAQKSIGYMRYKVMYSSLHNTGLHHKIKVHKLRHAKVWSGPSVNTEHWRYRHTVHLSSSAVVLHSVGSDHGPPVKFNSLIRDVMLETGLQDTGFRGPNSPWFHSICQFPFPVTGHYSGAALKLCCFL